jgi:adenine C2-methylase RlmN of 23S rRNA A2503 and tRNA A37
MEKTRLKDMSFEELTGFFVSMGEKPFRAKQVFKQMYDGAFAFGEMTDISKTLRERLDEVATARCLTVADVAVSKLDGTRKYLFETWDGLFVEAVLMEYYFGYSICISSQAGCRMGCRFCASGRHGLQRSLTAGEIVDQFLICERDVRGGSDGVERAGCDGSDESVGSVGIERAGCDGSDEGERAGCDGSDGVDGIERAECDGIDESVGSVGIERAGHGGSDESESCGGYGIGRAAGRVKYVRHRGDDGTVRIGHIVVMGVGEPFDNYDNVMKFLLNITSQYGRNLGRRQITVSTCGLIPGMRRFMEDLPQANLSVSLHAPNDGIRRRIMPVGAKYGVDEIVAFASEYSGKTGRRFTFEYALFEGINDDIICARELANLIAGRGFHVNLIPGNSVPGSEYKAPGKDVVTRFAEELMRRGIRTTTRRELGSDILAACGQLRSEKMAESERSLIEGEQI